MECTQKKLKITTIYYEGDVIFAKVSSTLNHNDISGFEFVQRQLIK